MLNSIIDEFKSFYNTNTPPKIYFSPGRVNIIGEHIDYNGGFVLPYAIKLGTYLLVSERDDNIIAFYSKNTQLKVEIELQNTNFDPQHKWANYPKGVINILQKKGYDITKGLNLYFYGDLPTGAGLSSSASIELATAFALSDIFNLNISPKNLALLCQEVENQYMGLNSGIMDQLAVATGKENYATLINTVNLEYSYIPMFSDKYNFVVIDSMVRRQLVDSKYNNRRAECETALKILQKEVNIKFLCDLTPEQFSNYSHLIKDSVIFKRAKHVVNEQQRTKDAAEALKNSNFTNLGNLLTQSHISLRDDYEVSCPQLDYLVEESLKFDSVLGARLIGAGFGGCVLVLVDKNKSEHFLDSIKSKYFQKFNLTPKIIEANSSDGVKRIL